MRRREKKEEKTRRCSLLRGFTVLHFSINVKMDSSPEMFEGLKEKYYNFSLRNIASSWGSMKYNY